MACLTLVCSNQLAWALFLFLSSVAPCLGWLEVSYSLIFSIETFLTVQEPEEHFFFQPPWHCQQDTYSMLKQWSFGKFFAHAEFYFRFYCAIKIFKHFETCISYLPILFLVLAIVFIWVFSCLTLLSFIVHVLTLKMFYLKKKSPCLIIKNGSEEQLAC